MNDWEKFQAKLQDEKALTMLKERYDLEEWQPNREVSTMELSRLPLINISGVTYLAKLRPPVRKGRRK